MAAWHETAVKVASLTPHQPITITVPDGNNRNKARHVMVVLLPSNPGDPLPIVRALDAICYHSGGPLAQGDIEDIDGFGTCIRCPWHRYLIKLETGEGVYQGLDTKYKSKGRRQRTHTTMISADGIVHVQLNSVDIDDESVLDDRLPSDTYCFGQHHQHHHAKD